MATQAAAVFDMATAIAAMVAQGAGTAMRIEEAIADYSQAIKDVQARSTETAAEAARRIGTAKEEGVLSIKEKGAQAAFEGRMAMTGAEMAASSEEARLGASGVRAKGSPLAAAQQNVDLAFAAADRTIEKGRAGVAIAGVRLKSEIAGIGAQESMLTAEYTRRQAEMERKRRELQENKAKMVALAVAGGTPGLATSFYNLTEAFG